MGVNQGLKLWLLVQILLGESLVLRGDLTTPNYFSLVQAIASLLTCLKSP